MSSSDKPVRRRRIAGETGAAVPKPPSAPQRPVVKKPVGRRRPVVPAAEAVEATAAPLKPAKPAKPARPAVRKEPAAPKEPAAAKEPKQPKEPKKPKQPKERGPGPSRRDLLTVVPLALVAIASLVIGAFLLVDGLGSKDDDVVANQSKAASAAGAAAETIFSFRYDQLDDHLATSKAVMTPEFAQEFEKIAPALTELAPQREIVVEAVTREAAAQPCGDSCSPDKADVLVFIDQARLVGGSKKPTVFANRIKVSMVRSDGNWLVSDIRAL